VEAVQPYQRGDVDELDQGGDDDGRERGFGEILEQAGKEEERDDGEGGDREARELGVGAG
jgi:hypothetical protein